MAPGRLEALAIASQADLSPPLEEPAPRALFDPEQQTAGDRRFGVHKLNFDCHNGTFLLELSRRKLAEQLLPPRQLNEFKGAGFRIQKEPHITVLSWDNGRRLVRALGGQRSRLKSVADEAAEIDWTWRPTGQMTPFQGRHRGNVKLLSWVDCPGIAQFYDRLEECLPGLELDRWPPHVTLMRRPGSMEHYGDAVIGGVAIKRPIHTFRQLCHAA